MKRSVCPGHCASQLLEEPKFGLPHPGKTYYLDGVTDPLDSVQCSFKEGSEKGGIYCWFALETEKAFDGTSTIEVGTSFFVGFFGLSLITFSFTPPLESRQYWTIISLQLFQLERGNQHFKQNTGNFRKITTCQNRCKPPNRPPNSLFSLII